MTRRTLTARLWSGFELPVDGETIESLQTALRAWGVSSVLADPAIDFAEWRASGLRTVPALELLDDGRPVASWAGSVALDAVHEAIENVRGVATTHKPAFEPVPEYEIVASSGSHRYLRWNEQSLMCVAPTCGWSSPSRRKPVAEWLDIDLMGSWWLAGVSLTPRDWVTNGEFQRSFPFAFRALVSGDGNEWEEALAVYGYSCATPEPQRWEWSPRLAARVRLEFDATNARRDGKYFCQLAAMQFWHQSGHPHRVRPAFGSVAAQTPSSERLPEKRGVAHSGDTVVEAWTFHAGQRLPPRLLRAGRIKWLVLEGALIVRWWDGDGEARTRRLERHDTVTFPRAATFALEAPTESGAHALVIASGDLESELWANP